jgi:hypothetical protein
MPRRRRSSQAIREGLSAPPVSQGWFLRAIVWLFRSEASSTFVLGTLIALAFTGSYLVPFRVSSLREFLVGAFALLIFGLFLAVILVTEENKNYRGNGLRTRVVCGAIAGAAIAALISASAEAAAFGALLGSVLGFFGMSWAKYL